MINYDYDSSFFDPKNLDHAKHIILTSENSTSEERWIKETEWTIKTIDAFMNLDSDSLVLDWGCGIGRISKPIIEKYGCNVVGVDLQSQMLSYAKEYVNSDLFHTILRDNIFTELIKYKFTHVIACWVFQHSNMLQYEIPVIYNSMKMDSQIFLIELNKKAIPNKAGGFYDDKISSKGELEKYFNISAAGKIPIKYTTKKISDMSWWALLNRKLIL